MCMFTIYLRILIRVYVELNIVLRSNLLNVRILWLAKHSIQKPRKITVAFRITLYFLEISNVIYAYTYTHTIRVIIYSTLERI